MKTITSGMIARFAAASAALLLCFAATTGFAAEVGTFYEYVETDGSKSAGEYVLLDYTPTSDSVIETTVVFLDISQNGFVFCARGSSTTDRTFSLLNIGNSGLRWDYNRTDGIYATINANEKYNLVAKNDGLYVNGEKKIAVAPLSYTAANKIVLFASYTAQPGATPAPNDNYSKLRLYSFKAYDREDGALVPKLDLRPCIDSNGTAALYDTVNARLYYATPSTSGKQLAAGGNALADTGSLVVSGSPSALGEVTPAYGVTNGLAAGDSFVCTAPATWTRGDGKVSATCRGWTVYTNNAVYMTGAGNSFTYVQPDCASGARLVWNWDAISTTTKCYVSTNESATATYPYDSWETATHDLNVALAMDVDEVEVGDGTFVNTNMYYFLDRAVKVYSSNGPAKTTLQAKSGGGQFEISHDGAFVSGFTIKDALGSTWMHGSCFNMSAGTVSNCVITGTLKANYFSPCLLKGTARMTDCDIDASGFSGSGWDSAWGILELQGSSLADRCSVHGWRSTTTMNANLTSFAKTPVIVNSANAVLRNSLVYGNSHGDATSSNTALSGGGIALLNGTVENCTVVDNFSSGYGGGIYAPNTTGKIINCVVWGNTSVLDVGNDIYAPRLASDKMTYICSEDVGNTTSISNGVGIGCTALNPAFDDTPGKEYRLTLLSVSCLDKGGETAASAAAGAKDLDGNPRLDEKSGIVDIGCFEFVYGTERIPLSANITVTDPGTVGSHDISFEAFPVGDDLGGLSLCWNFGDGTTSTEGLTVTHTYQPGRYEPFLSLANVAGEATNVYLKSALVIVPQTVYVAVDGSETFPYDTWEKATTNLATAIDVGSPEVVVGDGTFEHTVYEHAINRALVLRSLNGPEKTILKRRASGGRHFNVSNNLNTQNNLIAGFTCYGANGGFNTEGFFRIGAGVVSNCVFTGDLAGGYHKFCYLFGNGTAVDCEFDGGKSGPGVYFHVDGTVYMLCLEGNAIADRCHVHDFRVTSSDSANSGQKFSPVLLNSANAVFQNSLVRDCSVRRSSGGDAYIAALSGGGIRIVNGTVANCTVVNCDASGDGGGIWASTANGKIVNCIAWNNTCSGTGGKDIHAPALSADKVTHSRAGDFGNDAAVATGAGCLVADPLFAHPERNDFRLTVSSPCREAGDNSYWTDIASVRDLAGNPRKASYRVDMGCYETVDIGFIMLLK